MGERRGTQKEEEKFVLVFGGKPEGNRTLGRPRSGRESNIKIGL
jgi:hypothetical protein